MTTRLAGALLGAALFPITAPLSLGMTVVLAVVPNADVRTSTDPTIVRMRSFGS